MLRKRGKTSQKYIAQANFGAPKFGYPCRALHKPLIFYKIC